MKRFLKILHTLGAIGFMGGLAAELAMAILGASRPAAEHAVLRAGIDALGRWLILPSLPLVLVSGLLSMGLHPPFHNAGWVWVKLATTVVTFEGTLGLMSRLKDLARLANEAVTAPPTPVYTQLLSSERGVVWTLLFLSGVNVVVGVWRPRWGRKKRTVEVPEAAPASTPAATS